MYASYRSTSLHVAPGLLSSPSRYEQVTRNKKVSNSMRDIGVGQVDLSK